MNLPKIPKSTRVPRFMPILVVSVVIIALAGFYILVIHQSQTTVIEENETEEVRDWMTLSTSSNDNSTKPQKDTRAQAWLDDDAEMTGDADVHEEYGRQSFTLGTASLLNIQKSTLRLHTELMESPGGEDVGIAQGDEYVLYACLADTTQLATQIYCDDWISITNVDAKDAERVRAEQARVAGMDTPASDDLDACKEVATRYLLHMADHVTSEETS